MYCTTHFMVVLNDLLNCFPCKNASVFSVVSDIYGIKACKLYCVIVNLVCRHGQDISIIQVWNCT